MTQENYTHIQLVVDRSGSMSTIKDDMNAGMSEFLKTQAAEPGKLTIGVTRFDQVIEHLVKPGGSVEDIDGVTLVDPRGSTALNDGIGQAVNLLGSHLASLPEDERPANVIVMVVTDGYENASHEFSVTDVKKLIEEQTAKYNWDFMFLGANLDAQKVGSGYGIPVASSYSYTASAAGAANLSSVMTANVLRSRSGVKGGFTKEEREADAANATSV